MIWCIPYTDKMRLDIGLTSYVGDIPIEDNEMLQAQAEAGNPMAAQAIADREAAIQSLAAAYQQETEQIVAAAGDIQSGVVKV